jgi:hypothetical protein
MNQYAIDAGTDFGLWDDSVSQLMYFGVMPHFLREVDTSGRVADYGGANGLLKQFIPHSISIDIDPSKEPDIVGDIRTHIGSYDLIVMRYVLHYLEREDQANLFEHIARFHGGEVLVIQFTNDGEDYRRKIQNSINETKYFHTRKTLFDLFSPFHIIEERSFTYTVTAEFYANRLDNPAGIEHGETCRAVLLRRK